MELEGGIEGAGRVGLATPVSAILGHLEQLGGKLGAGVVVTDVGSTKRTIVETAERVMKFPGRFVGSHPMAGGEMHGPSTKGSAGDSEDAWAAADALAFSSAAVLLERCAAHLYGGVGSLESLESDVTRWLSDGPRFD